MPAKTIAVTLKARSTPTQVRERLGRWWAQPWARWGTAVAIGGFIPLTGFSPLNHAAAVLDIESQPWRVVLTPPVLLAIAVLLLSWILPRRPPALPRPVQIAAPAFVLAGCLSLLGSSDVTDSALVLVEAIVAPLVTCWALRRTELSRAAMCGAFLTVTAALLLRDDWVFISQNGAPSGHALFVTKFSNVPYDFHYYGLQNPDMFATFLLIPLALSAFWSLTEGLTRTARGLLIASAALCMFTLVLAYVRFDIGAGVVIVVAAIWLAPISRRIRLTALVPLVIAACALALSTTTRAYISDIFQTGSSASGIVRVTSIADGLGTMLHHPLTGIGLDRYGSHGGTPAHSSIAQAAAEMGILGLLSLVALTLWLLCRAFQVLGHRSWTSVAPAAALAGGIYAICTALTGGAKLGLTMNFVPVWALSIVLAVVASDPEVGAAGALADAQTAQASTSRRRALVPLPAGQLSAALSAVATLALAGAGIASAHSPPSPSGPVLRPTSTGLAKAWSFGLPPGWLRVRNTRLALASGAIQVRTGGSAQSYQLLGPGTTADPGNYRVSLTTRVLTGGESLGVLDVSHQRFLTGFTVRPSRRVVTKAADFQLSRRTLIEIVLSDARPTGIKSSTWLVKNVAVVARGPQP